MKNHLFFIERLKIFNRVETSQKRHFYSQVYKLNYYNKYTMLDNPISGDVWNVERWRKYMMLDKDNQAKSKVGVIIYDRSGKKNAKGKKSMSFVVNDTTMDELDKVLKNAVRTQ